MSELSDALTSLDRAIARRRSRLTKGAGTDRIMAELETARRRVIGVAIRQADRETLAKVGPRELEAVGAAGSLAAVRAARRTT